MLHRIIISDLSPEEIYPDPLGKSPRCATSHRPAETAPPKPSPKRGSESASESAATSGVDPFPAKKPITRTNPDIPPT